MLIYFVHISFESFSQFNYYASLLSLFFFSSLFVFFFFAFVIIYIANDVRIGDDWTLFVCVHFRHLSFYHFVEIYFGVRVSPDKMLNSLRRSFHFIVQHVRFDYTAVRHGHSIIIQWVENMMFEKFKSSIEMLIDSNASIGWIYVWISNEMIFAWNEVVLRASHWIDHVYLPIMLCTIAQKSDSWTANWIICIYCSPIIIGINGGDVHRCDGHDFCQTVHLYGSWRFPVNASARPWISQLDWWTSPDLVSEQSANWYSTWCD